MTRAADHLDWTDHGACLGQTQLFFAPHAERPQARARREAAARQVCLQCAVLEECRSYARRNYEYGFWGGESEDERMAAGFAVPDPAGSRSRRAS
jgi:WhiB family redox-sensing transcriptional regulator